MAALGGALGCLVKYAVCSLEFGPGGMHYVGDQEIAMMCEVDLLRLPVLMVSGLRTPYTVCRTTSEIYSYLTESVERSGPLGSRAIWNASRSIDTSG